MKTYRFAPWVFLTAAIMLFSFIILVSAQITSVMASSPILLSEEMTSNPQDTLYNFLPILSKANPPSAIIIDHNNRDVALIPPIWIQAAMQNVIWSYGSTSHGTQLWAGADYLSSYVNPPAYNFTANNGSSHPTRAIHLSCAWVTTAALHGIQPLFSIPPAAC